jgi:hypothetical protein
MRSRIILAAAFAAFLALPAFAQIPGGGVPIATTTVAGKMKCDGVTTTCAADGTVTATAGGSAGINQLTGDVAAGPAAGSAAATVSKIGGKAVSLAGALTTGGALTTTGVGAISLAFPAVTATFTFPGTSKTLLATDLSNIGTGTIAVANLPGLTASHFFAGDAGNRPIDASITGDLGCGTAAAGFITCTNTGIQGRAVASTAPSDTNVLGWDAAGSTWKPIAAGAGGGSPSGSAGDIQTYATSTTFGHITPSVNMAAFLASSSSANLAAALTDETGTGLAVFNTNPTLAGATLTGTLALGTQTVSGGFTMSGVPLMTGLSAGTQTKCLGLDSGNHIVYVASACGAGGGSAWDITDGTHTVTSVTGLTVGNGFLVGGSAGAATLDSYNQINSQSGTGAYAIVAGDAGLQVIRTNASGGADTIAAASTTNFTSGYSVMYTANGQAGNTITPASGTIGGLSVLKVGKNQSVSLDSDGTNYNVAASVPIPATQTGSTLLHDDMTWSALPTASTSTAGIAKLHNVPLSVGWIATVNPNKAIIATVHQASRISAIIGRVSDATNNGTATVAVYKAPSGTACSAGTILHSGTLNANGTANTNQTLTLVGGATDDLADGDSLCLVTAGTTSWTGGAGVGSVSVFLAPI